MSLRSLAPGGLASLLALGAACENQGKTTGSTRAGAITTTLAPPTGTSSTTPKAAGTGDAAAAFCAPDTVVTTPAGAAAFEVTTPHYRLHAEVAPDQAVEMGRLLEAAFPAFQAWFQAAPSGGSLRVNVYAGEAAWESGLGADGIVAPTEAGGYYSQTTKTAYLYAQANPYYTHVLLLHEAAHQFHELSRTRGQILPFWYAEGHAEYLSRHDWDGRCVRLGVIPLLSWEDLPGQALHADIDVPAVVSGASPPSREAAWALFRYLDTGPHHDAFRVFRDAFDAGDRDPARSFAALVADPATLSAPLAAWLPGAQEPMKPVFTEWTHEGPRATTGDSPGYFSQAIVKARVTHFEARYDLPSTPTWALGLVLGYQDDQTYQAILVSADGRLRTFTAGHGSTRWSDAGTAPPDSAGTGFLSVDFGAASAKVTVNGAVSSHALTGLPAVAGLAISDARVSFHDLSWR